MSYQLILSDLPMTTLLLSLTTLCCVSYIVILKIRLAHAERKLLACEDSIRWFTKQPGDWNEATHSFVQSLKIHLKGEA